MISWQAQKSDSITGTIVVPGDKSIAHRAVILSSIAEGVSTIHGTISGEDVLGTVSAFEHMEVEITETKKGLWTIQGTGASGLSEPRNVLDMGNSGTSMRLLSGLLAGQPFLSVLTGDPYLRRRPMDRVVEPLLQMGARIDGRKNGTRAPLSIRGGNLNGIHYVLPVASAQVKSCVLLAGLYAKGETIVEEKKETRDHTERMMHHMGASLETDGNRIHIRGNQVLTGQELRIPGDISSAAFFIVAATLIPDSEILLKDVGTNPRRTGILTALTEMGADIELTNERQWSGEPVADILVRSSDLTGIDIPPEWIPSMVDEIPALAIAAAFAEGTTTISGAAELRVKESDRIAAMSAGLGMLGVHVVEHPDGMVIEGRQSIEGGTVESYGDHRIAMAMAVAGLISSEPVQVCDVACVDTSFPGFAQILNNIGAEVSVCE